MIKKVLIFFIGFLLITGGAFAQPDVKGWHLLDADHDGFNGISLNKTYEFLKGKKSRQVIVAVIDTGVDTTQEDLKNVLWKNPMEIAGNGIDDDNNGYTDDVYGWNFLGGKDGRNLKTDDMEVSRVYHRFKGKFFERMFDADTMCSKNKEEYLLWKKAASELELKPEEQVDLMFLEMAFKAGHKSDKILREEMLTDEYAAEQVEKFQPQNARAKQAKLSFLSFLKITDVEPGETNKSILSQLEEYIQSKKKTALALQIGPRNQRSEIVGDNYYDINDRFYGNSDVMGPLPLHGTHISGIIGAQRGNGLGVDGVADNVRIMTVRALPDGDEYDKDVALAIRYAVDNGAKVINMSFGKAYSPEKEWVDQAVKYAEQRDVLIVHAAGNEAEDVDENEHYPNATLVAFDNSKAANFITVGASSDPKLSKSIVAEFSNYGKNNVDVFAPGVKIYSTFPGGNKYGFLKGTSMATPVVAGLAALIRSYYPQLSAKQVKYVIEKSATEIDPALKVIKPGTKAEVPCSELCTSGGVINAYKAIQLASSLVEEKKEINKNQLPKSTFKNLKISR